MRTTLTYSRHGKTDYTGLFPDLTPKGKEEMQQTARAISDIAVGIEEPVGAIEFHCSPLPRALGSMDFVTSALGYRNTDVIIDRSLRCMDFLDQEGARVLFQETFASARDIDRIYDLDPRFEEGTIVERRSDVRTRMFGYLGKIFDRFVSGNMPRLLVGISHYETLYHLISRFDDPEPLLHGEIIRLDLDDPVGQVVPVTLGFRGKIERLSISLSTDLFAKQFI